MKKKKAQLPKTVKGMYFKPTDEQFEKLLIVRAGLEEKLGGRVSWQQTLSYVVTAHEAIAPDSITR